MSRCPEILLIVLAVGLSLTLTAQSEYLLLNRDAHNLYEQSLYRNGTMSHSSVKPYMKKNLVARLDLDSMESTAGFPLKKLSQKYASDTTDPGKGFLRVNLLGSILPGIEFNNTFDSTKNINRTHIGFGLDAGMFNTLHLNFSYITGNDVQPAYLSSYSHQNNVVTGMGYAHGTKKGEHYKNIVGSLSFAPGKIFAFQAGKGKHFFGDGYRSLLLSDYTNPYLFLKVTTTVWKFKYVNLFTNMKDIRGSDGDPSDFQNKYTTMHYLSFDITKRFNLSLFEAVVWQGSDTLTDRGFDVNYLNPVIFLRPVEFSVGSPDNSLIGANVSYLFGKGLKLYGQLLLDEFLLSEVRAQNGWWGNKQAVQVGFKYFDAFGLKGLRWQTEYNYVRPFTYTHGSSLQNYGHFNQPLAHPLGANFDEFLTLLGYQFDNWYFEASFQRTEKGLDYAGRNLGGDIYISSGSREREYGHFTGQGVQNQILAGGLRASYLISPNSNLRFELGWVRRSETIEPSKTTSDIIHVGLRTFLFNQYTDF